MTEWSTLTDDEKAALVRASLENRIRRYNPLEGHKRVSKKRFAEMDALGLYEYVKLKKASDGHVIMAEANHVGSLKQAAEACREYDEWIANGAWASMTGDPAHIRSWLLDE